MFTPLLMGQDWDLNGAAPEVVPFLRQSQARAELQALRGQDSYNDGRSVFDQATTVERGPLFSPTSFFKTGQTSDQAPLSVVAGETEPWSEPIFDQNPHRNVFAPSRMHFQLAVEGVALARGAPTGGTFVFDDSGDALGYEDLGLGMGVGGRYSLRVLTDNEAGFEFAYYRLGTSLEQTVAGRNVLPVFYGSVPAEPQPSYTVQYDSRLTSYELNFWGISGDKWRMGLGYRQFKLDENFNIIRTADPTIGFFSDTHNKLKGVQILLERRQDLSGLIQFFAVGKLGFFNNEVQINGIAANAETHIAEDVFSFVADINTGLRFTLTEYAQVSVGYQALLFTNIGTAPEQSAQFSLFNPNAGSTHYGDAPFHGFSFGATLAY